MKLEETEGNSSLMQPRDWPVADGPHVLLADVTSHVGPICLLTQRQHVSVSEAGVIRYA